MSIDKDKDAYKKFAAGINDSSVSEPLIGH